MSEKKAEAAVDAPVSVETVLAPQDAPAPATGDVWAELIQRHLPESLLSFAEERRRQGIERYGTPLQAFNGRDIRMDLFQEVLDGIAYAHQGVLEGKLGMEGWRDRLIHIALEMVSDPYGRFGEQGQPLRLQYSLPPDFKVSADFAPPPPDPASLALLGLVVRRPLPFPVCNLDLFIME